jgi:hypothetical protein
MRLNAVALYIMLPCSMVLLAPTSVSVKPQTPSLQGTYTLDAAASDDVDKAIDAAVKELSVLTRATARSRLRKINVSYKQISISYTEAEVSIATDQRQPLRTPVNGAPVDWTREDGEKLKVSTVWDSGKLKRTFKAEAGQRINTYIISADGKTLTMQVSVTSTHLPQPLTYKLVYQRRN